MAHFGALDDSGTNYIRGRSAHMMLIDCGRKNRLKRENAARNFPGDGLAFTYSTVLDDSEKTFCVVYCE